MKCGDVHKIHDADASGRSAMLCTCFEICTARHSFRHQYPPSHTDVLRMSRPIRAHIQNTFGKGTWKRAWKSRDILPPNQFSHTGSSWAVNWVGILPLHVLDRSHLLLISRQKRLVLSSFNAENCETAYLYAIRTNRPLLV